MTAPSEYNGLANLKADELRGAADLLEAVQEGRVTGATARIFARAVLITCRHFDREIRARLQESPTEGAQAGTHQISQRGRSDPAREAVSTRLGTLEGRGTARRPHCEKCDLDLGDLIACPVYGCPHVKATHPGGER